MTQQKKPFTFADIAPSVETLEIRGTKLKFRGIGCPRCFDLVMDFPAIAGLLVGTVNPVQLIKEFPQAGAALACEGLGRPDDKDLAASFFTMALGDQVKVMTAVLKATMPDGRDPFVQLARTLGYELPAGSTPSSSPATSASPSPS